MAIDRLNFSGASGSANIETPLGSLSDRLMKYGSMLNTQDMERERLKNQEEQTAYQRGRDALIDTRYNADRAERLGDKFDAKQKEIATNENLALTADKNAFLGAKTSAEDKSYADAIASVSDPIEKQRLQSEYNAYKVGNQKQDWVNAVTGQTNVDQKQITNLKQDMAKQAADEAYKQQSLALQGKQVNASIEANKIAQQNRLDQINAGQAYINAKLNAPTVSSDTIKIIPSPTGDKIIPSENQSTYNESMNQLTTSPEMQKKIDRMNELGSKGLYTLEQLKDENFMMSEYNKLHPEASSMSRTSKGAYGVAEDFLNYEKQQSEKGNIARNISSLQRSLTPSSTEQDIKNINDQVDQLKKQAKDIDKKYENVQKNDKYVSFDDFKKDIKNQNTSNQNELAKLQSEVTNAYQNKQTELDTKLGKVKDVEVKIPKTKDEYVNDIYTNTLAKNPGATQESRNQMMNAAEEAGKEYEIREKAKKLKQEQIVEKRIENANSIQKEKVTILKKDKDELESRLDKIATGNIGKGGLRSSVTGEKIDADEEIQRLRSEIASKDKQISDTLGIK